jgi:hypothetical protein
MTWAKVRERIRSFAALRDGWDSYGGKAATPDTLKKAIQWAVSMEAVGFPPPWVVLGSDGHIEFDWEKDGHSVCMGTAEDCSAFFTEPVRLDAERSAAFRKLLGS